MNDSLLSGTVPGVMDAWYILLSQWGTKTLRRTAGARHRAGRTRRAHGGRGMNSRRAEEVSHQRDDSSAPPDGQRWKDGEVWKNPDLARTLRRLVEAEKAGRSAGPAWPA